MSPLWLLSQKKPCELKMFYRAGLLNISGWSSQSRSAGVLYFPNVFTDRWSRTYFFDFYSFFLVCLSEPESEDQRDEMLKKFERFQRLAELYYVYRSIQRYTVRMYYFVGLNLSLIFHNQRRWKQGWGLGNHSEATCLPVRLACSWIWKIKFV